MSEKEIDLLLNWYHENKRDLPWRHTYDSYKIWISEVMLQQTRVEAVKEYYERFLSQLPTITDLAEVSEDVLLKLWEGLGYYSRARNLKKCATEVIRRGFDALPNDEETLQSLPGIGPYTAGAILSIAYQKCVPAIDGNVLRVLSRIYEDNRDMLSNSVRKSYENLLKSFMKRGSTRDFTEGFIELGALVCIPSGNPLCLECPFKSCCKSYQHGTTLQYPVKKKKSKRKVIDKTVYILEYQKKYVILKREDKGLLAGMYELTNVDDVWSEEDLKRYLTQDGFVIKDISFLGKFKHIFSHIEWHMNAYVVRLKSKHPNYSFYSKEKIERKYSLPSAFQKIFIKIK